MENTEIHYEMQVRQVNNDDIWNEKLNSENFGIPQNDDEAVSIAKAILKFFNSSLRPGENKRELVEIQRIETKVIDILNSYNHKTINELQ